MHSSKNGGRTVHFKTLNRTHAEDIGRQIGVYGKLQSVTIDAYGQLHAAFAEERYRNIEVLIGAVYEHSNQSMYPYLNRILEYYEKNKEDCKKNYFVAGGMVNRYNEQLVVEVQARYGFVIDGKNIAKLMVEQESA